MGFPVKQRQGDGCWCWVAGVSILFLCGGTDWKFLQTIAASKPMAQLFTRGSVWWGAFGGGFIGVGTDKHRRASYRYREFLSLCVCGLRMIFHVGGGSKVTAPQPQRMWGGESSFYLTLSPTLSFSLSAVLFFLLMHFELFFTKIKMKVL